MTKKKNKYDKPLKLDMPFEEAVQRLSRVEKSKVEDNIKKSRSGKKKD